MEDKSCHQISEIRGEDGRACDLHGRAWTGVPVAANEATGGYAVLQYIHPDYTQVTLQHISAFSTEKICCECGDPTEPLPKWAVERILKAHPYLVLKNDYRWDGICYRCANDSVCPHCSGKDGDEDENDTEEEEGFSSHPYCH